MRGKTTKYSSFGSMVRRVLVRFVAKKQEAKKDKGDDRGDGQEGAPPAQMAPIPRGTPFE
jgi:hypothetical protein